MDLQKQIKNNILDHYTTDDFELEKLFIGVTTIHNFKVKTTIYSNFCNLEDAIDCCFASSHIPFITGNIINKYKNIFSFDGGFSKNPYLDSIKSDFHISSSIWDKENIKIQKSSNFICRLNGVDEGYATETLNSGVKDARVCRLNGVSKVDKGDERVCIEDITTLFSKEKYDCNQLLLDGYNDSKKHEKFLDTIFTKR